MKILEFCKVELSVLPSTVPSLMKISGKMLFLIYLILVSTANIGNNLYLCVCNKENLHQSNKIFT